MTRNKFFSTFLLRILTVLLIAGGIAEFAGFPVTPTIEAASKKKTSRSSKSRSKSSGKSKSSKRSKKSSDSKKSKKTGKSGKSRTNSKSSRTKRDSRTRGHRSSHRSNTGSASKYTAPKAEVPQNDSLTLAINSAMLKCVPKDHDPGGLRVNAVRIDQRSSTANISLNENFTYLPVTQSYITDLQRCVKNALPDSIANYRVNLSVASRPLSYYINHIDKLPENHRKNPPFVRPANPYANITKGMDGDVVALWSSHGRYFKNGAWAWQRPLLFESLEDTYTMGYVIPFLLPMLENAGAYPIMPRERDFNRHEVIVDNDTNEEGQVYSQPYFKFTNGLKKWRLGEGEGFIYDLPDFRDTENPFENGTYWEVNTIKSGAPSIAAWYADIPEDAEYAVYVSYKSLPNSATDAHYTVNYSGGTREFKVNQTMGGSTWIYLGTFPLEAGYSDTEPIVTLSNISSMADRVVTADAVKIGGGMGNIARSRNRSDIYYDPSTPDNSRPDEDEDEDEVDPDDEGIGDAQDAEAENNGSQAASETRQPATPPEQKKGRAPSFSTSGLPRYLEGARYWMHWAGFPEYVYSPFHGRDDYKDDYTSRGHWVNYLAGGSRVLPDREGLGIPVDLSFALHSDAGKRSDDSFVGTLGIYYTNGGASYADGTPRKNSRFLTDMLMRQITGDVRKLYEPSWTRRSMWDKSYLEARVPEVPTTLIELMSHQNFADMQYGLDPGFRFDVARAIYKGMGRFLAERKGREFVVQPLPVKDFAIKRKGNSRFRLSWTPTPDPLEPSATPGKYIIFERSEGDMGFHKIGETSATHFDVQVTDHDIHSFRIVAANAGGLSFDSETLALREGKDGQTPVLIVNGFTRISAPGHFSENGRAGFNSEDDAAVPYIKDASFTGHQTEFRRGAGESFGRSSGNYIGKVIAGNTFDFTSLHGAAVAASGRGFVSCAVGAVENGNVNLKDFKVVDLILGKQKATITGRGSAPKSELRYLAFPKSLQKHLSSYLSKGGRLMVSGQYVASDLTSPYAPGGSREFGERVLGIVADSISAPRSGRLRQLAGVANTNSKALNIDFYNTLNDRSYIVERPDVIAPAPGIDSSTLLTFEGSDLPAALLNNMRNGRTAVMSVPFESIKDPAARAALMENILLFLSK